MAESLNQYETVIILSAKLGDDGNEALVEKFKSRIEKHGTVESIDSWGKRRLAYPINKETEGYYTLINFTSAPDFTAELDRRYQITDGVLRTLIIKKDPRLLLAEEKRKAEQAAQAAKKAAAQSESANTVDVEALASEAIEADIAQAAAEGTQAVSEPKEETPAQ